MIFVFSNHPAINSLLVLFYYSRCKNGHLSCKNKKKKPKVEVKVKAKAKRSKKSKKSKKGKTYFLDLFLQDLVLPLDRKIVVEMLFIKFLVPLYFISIVTQAFFI